MNKNTIRECMRNALGFAPCLKDINIICTDGNLTTFTVNDKEYIFDYEKIEFRFITWTCQLDKSGYEYEFKKKNVHIPNRTMQPSFYILNAAEYSTDPLLRAAIRFFEGAAHYQIGMMSKSAQKKIACDILNYIAWRDDIREENAYSIADITDELVEKARDYIYELSNSDYLHYEKPAKIIAEILF